MRSFQGFQRASIGFYTALRGLCPRASGPVEEIFGSPKRSGTHCKDPSKDLHGVTDGEILMFTLS